MIGETIGHYRITGELGSGGMGVVYQAEDIRLRRTVALKVLTAGIAAGEEERQRFITEARAAAALDHPNIGAVFEIGETPEGELFIAMAFYSGATLRHRLDAGHLDIIEALEIHIQIASGLAEAHEKDIIHRDIKPANIMLDEKGVPKVVDFGLAKVSDVHLTQTGSTLGTVLYMSPERVRGEPPDQQSDIWSLGVVFYEMLTGRLPFSGEHEATVITSILNDTQTPVTDIRSNVPLELEQIVTRMLHKKQDFRYGRCDALILDLEKVLSALRSGRTRRFTTLAARKALRKPRVGIPIALGCILVLFLSFQILQRRADVRFAREVILPRIEGQIDTGKYVSAYRYAQEAERIISGDPDLKDLWGRLSYPYTLTTSVPGAEAWIREYTAPESTWILLGHTPIDSVRLPLGAIGCSLACEGYESRETMFTWFYPTRPPRSLLFHLSQPVPEDMIYIPSRNIPHFLIDRHEVTNQEFQEFVRAGGYNDRSYWKKPFIRSGEELDWEEVVSTFTEASGNRLGPANWQGGTYPEGEKNYPISGISWYEAAAYAEFAGKELPTSAHWAEAAFSGVGIIEQAVAAASNMSGEGPEPVGSNPGIGFFGLRDIAGNLAEWCLNESGDLRIICGGSYQDSHYMFSMADRASPFDRVSTIGFRCMRYLTIDDSIRAQLEAPVLVDVSAEISWPDPVPDPIYRTYLNLYQYDPRDIESDTIDEELTRYWRMQEVSFPAAYGDDEYMSVFVFTPLGIDPPYKPVVYWPGAEAIINQSSRGTLQTNRIDFLITRGNRAVVYPVLKGTYERGGGRDTGTIDYNSIDYRDWIVNCIKDLRRSVDFIMSEPATFDTTSIAYFGLSWGTAVGPIALAVEPRFSSGIFLSGGFYPDEVRDLTNGLHYAPRVAVPVLMLTGEFDYWFPHDSCQQRMFDLLGSSTVCWRTFPSGHGLSDHWEAIISLSLRWLDDPAVVVNEVRGREGFRVR